MFNCLTVLIILYHFSSQAITMIKENLNSSQISNDLTNVDTLLLYDLVPRFNGMHFYDEKFFVMKS